VRKRAGLTEGVALDRQAGGQLGCVCWGAVLGCCSVLGDNLAFRVCAQEWDRQEISQCVCTVSNG
jgi:hypothetical protein